MSAALSLVLLAAMSGRSAGAPAGGGLSATVAGSNGEWISLTPPNPRWSHTAIYDPQRDRMVVAGGYGGAPVFDVWEFSFAVGPTWAELDPSGVQPSIRGQHTAIYDPVRDRMVLFGGEDPFGSSLNDAWEFSLSGSPTWTGLIPEGTSPSRRYGHTAIYDPVRDRMVVFGGSNQGEPLNDVWELSLAGSPAWTRLIPAGAPPSPRYGHSAIYDPVRDRIVVFGGLASQSNDDVWELSLAGSPTWTRLSPAGTPPSPRYDHTAIHDPVRDRMVVFGGSGFLDDVWELSLAGNPTWTSLSPAGAPLPRYRHTAIYDLVRDRMVVFGGNENDVWGLSLPGSPTWVALAPSHTVLPERFRHAAIRDPVRDRLVVFAGGLQGPWLSATSAAVGGSGRNPYHGGNVWASSLAGSPGWTELVSFDGPASREGHSAIYDPVRDGMLVFGGGEFEGDFNDLWALFLAGDPRWDELTPAGTPPSPRLGHTAIHDPLRGRMVVFAGDQLTGGRFNDLWELSLAGSATWTELVPAGTPPSPREGHSAIYDPVRDRMVVFGGFDGSPLNDLWELSFDGSPTWTELTPAGTPPSPRNGHTAIYDPVRDRMVVLGGDGNGVWALSLAGNPTWTELTPAGAAPPGRAGHSAIYDPVRDRMVVYGGRGRDGFLVRNDVKALEWGTPLLPPPTLMATGGPASIVLSWSPSPSENVVGYRISYGAGSETVRYAGDQAAEGPSGIVVPDDQTSYTLTCLPDSAFHVVIQALGALGGRSGWSLEVSAESQPAGGTLTVHPAAINPRSNGQRVTAVLEPQAGYPAASLVAESLHLNEAVAAEQVTLGDADSDGVADLTLKFPRDEVMMTLAQGEHVEVRVVGRLLGCTDTLTCVVRDTIRWIQPHVVHPQAGQQVPMDAAVEIAWTLPTELTVDSVEVLVSVDNQRTWEVAGRGPAGWSMCEWSAPSAPAESCYVALVAYQGGEVTEVGYGGPFRVSASVAVVQPTERFGLQGAWPHPLRGEGRIVFGLPQTSAVSLRLFDLQGRLVKTIADGPMSAGRHEVAWDAHGVAAGVYFVQLRSSLECEQRRLVILGE